MAPSSCIELGAAEQSQLLSVARGSIAEGLATRQPLTVDAEALAGVLAGRHGNFVTLMQRGELRGCMGNLVGSEPLLQGVAKTAFNAAFHDPRFAPLGRQELELTQIEISVLTPPALLPANSPEQLLEQVRPQVHGLIVEDQGRRGTLLPKVWEQLPDAREFVAHVMLKAGLRPDHWSATMRWYWYESVCFGESGQDSKVAV